MDTVTRKSWLQKFCKDVFVDDVLAHSAAGLVNGGLDGYIARHQLSPTLTQEKLWAEESIWFVRDSGLLDLKVTPEEKRVAILERLEKNHGLRTSI